MLLVILGLTRTSPLFQPNLRDCGLSTQIRLGQKISTPTQLYLPAEGAAFILLEELAT